MHLIRGMGRVTAAVAVALILAGCPADEPTPAPTPTPEPAPEDALPTDWTRCTNREERFSIGYPEDWQEGGPGLPDCRFFDPEPLDPVPDAEGPASAMFVEVERFDELADALRDPFGEETLLLEETEVAGREALQFELRHTEDLLFPEGTTRYGYLVRLNDRGARIETRRFPDEPEGPYQDHQEVVDTAARTVGGA